MAAQVLAAPAGLGIPDRPPLAVQRQGRVSREGGQAGPIRDQEFLSLKRDQRLDLRDGTRAAAPPAEPSHQTYEAYLELSA